MAGAGGSFGAAAAAVLAPGAAFLPRGLQRAFGEGACGLLGLELFLELASLSSNASARRRSPCPARRSGLRSSRSSVRRAAARRPSPPTPWQARPSADRAPHGQNRLPHATRAPRSSPSRYRRAPFPWTSRKRLFERPLLKPRISASRSRKSARLRQQPLGGFRTRAHRAQLFSQVRGGQPVGFGGVEVGGLELGVGAVSWFSVASSSSTRRARSSRRLSRSLNCRLSFEALATNSSILYRSERFSCDMRAFWSCSPARCCSTSCSRFSLAANSAPDAGNCSLTVCRRRLLSSSSRSVRSSFALRSASAARASEAPPRRRERLLEILDAPRQLLLPDGERVAFEREAGVVACRRSCAASGPRTSAPPRGGRLWCARSRPGSDRSAPGLVELGADGFDVAERELDGVELRAQTFVAPADRVERARDLQRLRFAVSALIRRRERAQPFDDGAGLGRRGFLPRLIVDGEGSRVVRGRRAVPEQLFPNRDSWRLPLILPKAMWK